MQKFQENFEKKLCKEEKCSRVGYRTATIV